MKQWMVVMVLVFCAIFSAATALAEESESINTMPVETQIASETQPASEPVLAEESESTNISSTETQVAAETLDVENQTNTDELTDVRIINNTSPGFTVGLGLGYSYVSENRTLYELVNLICLERHLMISLFLIRRMPAGCLISRPAFGYWASGPIRLALFFFWCRCFRVICGRRRSSFCDNSTIFTCCFFIR